MNKIPLFLDFDEVLADSIPAFVQVYNERYNANADHTQLRQYDFKDICPLLKEGEVKDIFGCDRFWELLKLKKDCYNVLNKKENIERFDYILVSIGSPRNLYKKSKYVSEHLPMIEQMILITNKHSKMNKQWVNMENSIFIDDHIDNLNSSNATYRICFKEKWLPWNDGWYGSTVSNWSELNRYLDDIWKFENSKNKQGC